MTPSRAQRKRAADKREFTRIENDLRPVGRFQRPARRGSALLTVLWLTAALSAIGLAVASQVRGETERATTNVDDVKAYFVARGAIERTAMRMFWGPDFFSAATTV